MKIYDDEYIRSMEVIEAELQQKIIEWATNIGNDFAVESRILSLGDSNKFGLGNWVNPDYHYVEVKNIIHSGKNPEEVKNGIIKEVRNYLQSLVENKIEESTLTITNLKDFRKCIKVVVDGDVFIDNNMKVVFKVAVEEVANKKN